MNFKKIALILFLAFISANSTYCMKYAKIIKCPDSVYYKNLKDQIAKVEGTAKEIWGIDDIWRSSKSFSIPAISNYLKSMPPQVGLVYYAKVKGLGYCFHESWLKELSKTEIAAAKKDKQIFSKY